MDGFKLLYQKLRYWYIDVFKDNYWEFHDERFSQETELVFQTGTIKRHRVKIEEIIEEFSGYKTRIIYNHPLKIGTVNCLINNQYIIVATFTILNKTQYDNEFPYIINIYTHSSNDCIIKGFSYINTFYEKPCKRDKYFELKHIERNYHILKDVK